MAKFYAPFDPAFSGGSLDIDHNRRPLGYSDSASAAILRNGLISSRSALSTAMFAQLDAVNRGTSTTRGVIIPSDVITFDSPSAGNLTWTNVYTSSRAGLRFESDPSIRPSASILSTTTAWVGPADPVDGGTIAKGLYFSASNAVNDVIKNNIASGSTGITQGGPYQRLGNYPSRTLHSLYHDYDLNYFAWEDFTPGEPREVGITKSGSNDIFYYTDNFRYKFFWSGYGGLGNYEFKNDETAKPIISATFKSSSDATLQTLNATELSAGVREYDWTITSDPAAGGKILVDTVIDLNLKFRDATLQAEGITSDGTSPVVAGAAQLQLVRLYPRTLYVGGCGSTNAVTRYTVFQFNQLNFDIPGYTDKIYSNTNTGTPTGNGVADGSYYDDANGKRYIMADNTTIDNIVSC